VRQYDSDTLGIQIYRTKLVYHWLNEARAGRKTSICFDWGNNARVARPWVQPYLVMW